ncbi:MAG: hypothetical protein KC766_23410 [Myxococcales bacterium]|nr:hypothetical protein [Myxococcales bacterium]
MAARAAEVGGAYQLRRTLDPQAAGAKEALTQARVTRRSQAGPLARRIRAVGIPTLA